MKRLELIANRSIEEDIFEALEKVDKNLCYTKVPIVHGRGSTEPRLGDSVWPEENFLLIIYCENEKASKILKEVSVIKQYFPDEGIKIFEIDVVSSV